MSPRISFSSRGPVPCALATRAVRGLPLSLWCLGGVEPVCPVQGPQCSGRPLPPAFPAVFFLHLRHLPPRSCAAWHLCKRAQCKRERAHRPFPVNSKVAMIPAHFSGTLRGEEQSGDASKSAGGQPLTSPRSPETTSPHLLKALLQCLPRLALVSRQWTPLLCGALVRDPCLPGNVVETWVQGRHPGAAPCSSVREHVVPK